jgi:hypothetical protein
MRLTWVNTGSVISGKGARIWFDPGGQKGDTPKVGLATPRPALS